MPRKKKNKDNSELDEVLDVDETDDEERVKGGTLWTIIVAVVIIAIWLVIFGLLIKLDVGGFGSTVLRPILKDVPVINRILPDASDEEVAAETGYKYKNLAEAVEHIKELEKQLEQMSFNGLLEYNWENPQHEKQYVLPMFVPGSAEFTNMNSTVLEEHPEMGRFFERMRHTMKSLRRSSMRKLYILIMHRI